MRKYQLVAPDVNRLLNCFDRGFVNPSTPSSSLDNAMVPLFDTLKDLAPLKKNNEVKTIWLMIPRGEISDYGSYEEMREWGDVETEDEFHDLWLEDYPDPICWYELTIMESFHKDGTLWSRGVSLSNEHDHALFINANYQRSMDDDVMGSREEAAIPLCELLTEAAAKSMQMLKDGTYNDFVKENLPYRFKKGVIKRSALWAFDPEYERSDKDGLTENEIKELKELIKSGINSSERIGRLKTMTANDFFKACAAGYKACGCEGEELSPFLQYRMHADGRDEGLSDGYGMHSSPNIDFDDPTAWDNWYFDRNRFGGHPWEVIRGGNSTHVDLCVSHDQNELHVDKILNRISEEEYLKKMENAGYYFRVAGLHRVSEAVRFYISLKKEGLPVVLSDADEIVRMLDGEDYVGIVPHSVIPRYCEGMFPGDYGRVIDFMHVYDDDVEGYGKDIQWFDPDKTELVAKA